MASRRVDGEKSKQSRRPMATTPEAQENRLIGKAVNLAERQLEDGTASAQVITHYLKLGSSRERLEQELIQQNVALQQAKRENMASAARVEELYGAAIDAMRAYAGQEPPHLRMVTMTTEDFTIYHKRYDRTDIRLGRNVRHDSRSLNYQVEAEPIDSLKSVRHTRHIPILDQGAVGSCTGNAAIGCLGTSIFWDAEPVKLNLSATDAVHDEQYAVKTYSDATKLDAYTGSYPPVDTGSDGLSIAQVLKARGLISGYEHATSLEAALTALSKQPVIVGTEWRHDMFRPDPDGRLHITGSVDGGHEYVLDELDVERRFVWMANSWSTRWSLKGRAYFTWDDFGQLLAADGDCTVFTPLIKPAPTPTPPAPTPPAPFSPDAKAEFLQAYNEFSAAVVKFTSK